MRGKLLLGAVPTALLSGLLAIGFFLAGYGMAQYELSSAEAINVVGGEIVTRSETDADFRVFKSSEETVEAKAVDVNRKLRGQEKNTGSAISRDAQTALQFLVNQHQLLSDIQALYPCPSLEDWEAVGGTPTTNPPEYPDCDPDVLYESPTCYHFWEDLNPDDHPVLPGEPRETRTTRVVMVGIDWDGTIYNLRLADPSNNPANYPNNC
jgi:hypothetical protein